MLMSNQAKLLEKARKEKLRLFLKEFYVGSYQNSLRDIYNSYIDYEVNEMNTKKSNLMSFKIFVKHMMDTNYSTTMRY